MTFGQRLQRAVEALTSREPAKKWSQNKVAEAASTSSAVLSRYANDTKSTAKRDARLVARIAQVLGVRFEWLMLGEGAMYPLAERTIELIPRYPNLVEAIDRSRSRWLPETSAAMSTRADHWPEDRSVGTWIDEGDELDRQLRRGVKIGRRVEDEDDTPPAGTLPSRDT